MPFLLYLAGLSRKHFFLVRESVSILSQQAGVCVCVCVCVCSPACGGAEWLKRRQRLWEGG